MDRYPAASAASSVNPTSTTSTARNKNAPASTPVPTHARTPDFTTENSGPTTATPTLGSGSASRPISPTASDASTPSAVSTTAARRASRNPARRGGEGQPAVTLPTNNSTNTSPAPVSTPNSFAPNAVRGAPGASPGPRAPPEDGGEVVITLAPSRLGSNMSSSVNTSYVAEADMDSKSQTKSSHPSARGVVSSTRALPDIKIEDGHEQGSIGIAADKGKNNTAEPTLRTPANTPDDEKFTFKIMTKNWKDAKGRIDVLAYPPGVTHKEFVEYLKERGTLTAHTYPFRPYQTARFSFLTLGFWQQCWSLFLSPFSIIFAAVAGVTLSPAGYACLAAIYIFSYFMLVEFKEREQLFYRLLDHRIIINFHDVMWLKSRRVWVVFALSFGFIVDCWSGLPARNIYILANAFLGYAIALKHMFNLEDTVVTISRANEKYVDRNLPLPSYLNIDETVIRYYFWKLELDWTNSDLPADKSMNFSLAPLIWALQIGKLNLNVSLVEKSSWTRYLLPPRTTSMGCYNKCYATNYRFAFRDFNFNLSPSLTADLAISEANVALEGTKTQRKFLRRKTSSVLLLVEHHCLFEFPSEESTTLPSSIVSLTKNACLNTKPVDKDHSEVMLHVRVPHDGRTSIYRWTVLTSDVEILKAGIAAVTSRLKY